MKISRRGLIGGAASCAALQSSPSLALTGTRRILLLGKRGSATPSAPIVIPSGAVFALSRRKIAGWAGNALHVQRASDSAFSDIGFNANNDWDTAAMTAFAGGSALTVAFPYDNSGSGNDATAVTGTLMPALNPAISPCMIMDGFMSTTTTRIVNLPAGVAFNENNCSIFAVVKAKAAISDQCFFGFDQTTTNVNMYSGNDLGSGKAGYTAGFSPTGTNQYQSSRIVPMNKTIIGLVGNGGSGAITVDGGTASYTPTANAIAGGWIGEMAGRAGAIADFDLEAFFVWPRVLSGLEQTALISALNSAYTIPQSFTGQVIFDGDSITASLGTTQNKSWSRTIADATPQYKFYNTGVNGITLNAMQIASSVRTIGRFNSGVAKNILVIWGGTNDIVAGATGAATFTILQTYTAAAKVAGFKVVWVTMLPRTDLTTTPQAEWANYNAAMRGATLGQSNTADALADVQSDATMGPLAAASNHTLYINILPSNFSVGVHPTDAGTAFITPYIQNAINSL